MKEKKDYRGQCGCGRMWDALGQAHCARCHEHFNSDAAFDRHRTGPMSARRCIPAKLFSEPFGKRKAPLLVLVERADGPCWATALYDYEKAAG